MWVKCKYKGNLCFFNSGYVQIITFIEVDKEQYIVFEFSDSVYKIKESENENFKEIKAKLMGLGDENYNEEQAGTKLISSTLDSLYDSNK